MKKLLLFIAMVMMSLAVMAQSGNVISYQAVVRDANNRLVTNEAITVTIQVLDAGDNVVYTETDNVTSNANGLISLVVGDNNPTDFAAVNWSGAKFKTTVHVASSGYEVVSTTPVTAVPLAFYATNVDPEGATITAVYNKMQQDSLVLATRIFNDSTALQQNIDTVSSNVRNALGDTAGVIRGDLINNYYNKTKINDTITDILSQITAASGDLSNNYYTKAEINDTLNYYERKSDLCNDVMACEGIQTMQSNISTNATNISTNAAAITALQTKVQNDSTTLSNKIHADSVAFACKMRSDSLTLANKIHTDSTALHHALVDTAVAIRGTITNQVAHLQANIDTTSQHVRGALVDTAAAIRNSIGNGTLTIKNGESTLGTFQANTSQPAEINIASALPTVNDNTVAVSVNGNTAGSFTLNQNSDATINLNNVAVTTADNIFTGTNTVPRGFVVSGDNATNATNCNNIVVNACDLWAVFDSLNRRMDNILKTIDTLKHVNDSLSKELDALKPSLTVTGPSSTQYLCGGSNTITFNASITNANAADYSFSWTINGSEQSSTDATMYYTPDAAGAYKVICTASRSGYTTLKDSTTLSVAEGGLTPVLGICCEGRTVTVKITQGLLTSTVAWGDGIESVVTDGDTHEYANTGNYTIIASSTAYGNCKMSWPVTITETTPNPCTVNTPHTNTSTYTATTGGLESVVNGKVISVQDQDGHSYYVVQIGNQCWMRTNLRTSKYNDGTTIPGGENCSSISPTDPYHYINPSYDAAETGYFYNWPAASKKICPKGWHVPSQEDWETLLSAAGVSAPASTGTGAVYLAGGCDWENLTPGPSSMTPNSYENQDRDKWGFTAIPAGRSIGSTFLGYSQDVYFWTSTMVDEGQAKTVYLGNYTGVGNNALDKEEGRLVRCVRSEEGSEDPYLSLTASPDDETVLLCGTNIHTVTYTATIENDDASGYMFSWIVNGSPASEDGTSITRSWGNTGNHTVVCVATNGNTPLKDTVITSVTIGSVPDFEDVHIDALTVRLELPVGDHDVDSVAWGDNAGEKVPHDVGQVYHTYQTGGDYTITAYSVEGCTTTTEVSVAAAPAFACGTSTVSDADGNTYHTVAIGEGNNAQCWMKENLRTTKYADGTTIAQGSNHSTSEAYWYYPNNNANNKLIYGLLYNWKAVMRAESSSTAVPSGVQGICPEGWHVPSDQELQYLISNSSSSTATGKLAGGGSGTWTSSTTSATPGDYDYSERNSSGFSALPAGCYDDTYYDAFGTIAYFWSSTANPNYSGQSDYVALYYNQSTPNHNGYLQENGYSVRCVRDAESGGGGGSQTQTDPSVTTGNADPIGETSATLSATITNPDEVEITAKGFEYKRTSDNSYTSVSGTGTGNSFTADLTGLTAGTSYTYHAFITTASGTMTGDEETFTTESGSVTPPTPTDCGTVTDASGNTYNTVVIGSQCWMKENLRTTKYNGGTDISTYYDYSSSSIPLERRGYLYDWDVVMNQSGDHDICPSGWHVPSMDEWESLNISEYQCNGDIARALAANTDWYVSASTCAECDVCYDLSNNNSSGFSAIPAGFYEAPDFDEAESSANFWTSSYNNSYDEPKYVLISIWQNYYPSSNPAAYGYSVRCVRDGEVSVTTSSAANISTTGAWLRGNITARGNTITEKGFYWKTTEGGTYTKVTTAGGTLTYRLNGLTANTSYTYYAFASTADGTVYGDEVEFTTSSEPTVSNCGTVTDVDGNTYNTVVIGTQCWMKENLRTVGSLPSFENVTVSTDPFYYQTSTSDFAEYNVSTYGLYYNRAAALNNYNGSGIENPTNNIQGICPSGWHIPSKSEWQTLATATTPCQLAGSSDWNGNNWGTGDVSPGNYGYPYRNLTGFNALPSGQFDASSEVMDDTYPPHNDALFWSSSFDGEDTYYFRLDYYDEDFYYEVSDGNYAFPIRCLRDAESSGGGGGSSSTVTAPTGTYSAVSGGNGTISVSVSNLDFKEPGSGTVKIYYKPAQYGDWTLSNTFNRNTGDSVYYSVLVSVPEDDYLVKIILDNGETTELTSGQAIYVP